MLGSFKKEVKISSAGKLLFSPEDDIINKFMGESYGLEDPIQIKMYEKQLRADLKKIKT